MKFQVLTIVTILLVITMTAAKPIDQDKRGIASRVIKAVNKLMNKGIATFFDPVNEGGAQGACGPFADVNSQIVAMNAHQYGPMNKKSPWCGKKVKIMYKDKSTVATVTDACPGCGNGSLDLTPAVWGQLESDYDKGIIPITWRMCDTDCYN